MVSPVERPFSLRVLIPGPPVAQGRGRAVRFGDSVRVIDPSKSRSWKAMARIHMVQARARALIFAPAEVALRVVIVATFARPKSHPKRNPPAWKVSRPDVDNLAKSVLDAGNAVIWKDDSFVVELCASKRYGEVPSVSVEVTEAKDPA